MVNGIHRKRHWSQAPSLLYDEQLPASHAAGNKTYVVSPRIRQGFGIWQLISLGKPFRDIKVVAITGTNGKKQQPLCSQLFISHGVQYRLCYRQLKIKINNQVIPSYTYHSNAISVQRWLRQMVDEDALIALWRLVLMQIVQRANRWIETCGPYH